MMRALVFLFALIPALAAAQDYVMYETQYLTVRPGHAQQFSDGMKAHNDRFHTSGTYQASVWYINNGPRSGQFFWVMGPCTFSDLDNRPSSSEHQSDWADNVLAHAEQGEVEYWRMDEELTHNPNGDTETPAILRVRIFDLDDAQVDRFEELQSRIKEVMVKKNRNRTRTLYRNVMASGTGRDIAIATSFDNWAGLDDGGLGSFVKDFEEVHGAGSWARFARDRAEVVISDEDEFHELIPELSASPSTSNE